MNNPENQSSNERTASVSRQPGGLTVPASPLNVVKLDLAILLVVGGLLMLILWKMQPGAITQGVILFFYGFGAMFWLILRTRRILKQYERDGRGNTDNDQD